MSGRGSTTWVEASIPPELRASPRWVCWRYVYIKRDNRWTKVPVCARTGAAASSTDPATWCDYTTATAYAQAHAYGIGFMLGAGYAGVDLDDCLSGPVLASWAREIVDDVSSYTELTPSGAGVHILVRGTLPPGRRRTGQIEMYDGERFFTITGQHLPGTPTTIEPRKAELERLHREVFGPVAAKPAAASPDDPVASTDDRELIERIGCSRGPWFTRLWTGDSSSYPSPSEADLALCSILAAEGVRDSNRIDRLFRKSGLFREKWERPDYREGTIGRALTQSTEAGDRSPSRFARVRGEVERLRQLVTARPWRGLAGATDRAVMLALLDVAERVGSLEIGASVRWLAETVGVDKVTASRSLRRLLEAGWLVQRHASRGRVSAVFRIKPPSVAALASTVKRGGHGEKRSTFIHSGEHHLWN